MILHTINSETGELEEYSNQLLLDRETGEHTIPYGNPAFTIPKIITREPDGEKKCCLKNANHSYTLVSKKKVIRLKEEIILGYNKTSPVLFLIPTLIFFFRLTVLVLVLIEAILHIYAHRRNLRNENPHVYYRSPLHLLTSEFCGVCRAHDSMDKVSRIQHGRLTLRKRYRLKFALRNLV